ncbi:GNAT family N-acetyltransferase [Kitasatospora sp. NPDC004272]
MGIKIVPASGTQEELIEAAIALGNRYTKTLGLLTPPVYQNAADEGGLLIAVDGDEVIGYALCGLPKRSPHVRLTHLCVAEERRGEGVARLLVETIRTRYSQRLGIKVKCRRDYGLTEMWTSLGFVPRGEVRGRSKNGDDLDGWWLDHSHPDLFTDVESDALTIVVDHGVFADLRGLTPSPGALESEALEAGWLADLVELAFTPQLFRDVREIADAAERKHQRAALSGLRQITPASEPVAARSRELLEAARGAGVDLSAGSELERCVRYVAETSCAGLQVLVTRDPLLTGLADVAWDIAGVRVVHPSVVTLHVDELHQAQVYRPADLMGTEFRVGEVPPGTEGELVAFFDQSSSDNGSVFARRLRALAEDAVVWRRELLRDGDGRPVALYAWAMDGRTLTVPLLRTASHRLEQTLARQLLFGLKRLGRERGARAVHISDEFISPVAKAAAGSDGFFEHQGGQAALLVDVIGTADAVTKSAAEAARALGRNATVLQAGLSAEVTGAVERAWWPAKVTDSLMPSFMAPIKPRWSTELFNVPAMLLPRSSELGISREHVYYRSPGHRNESVPGRLLWYVSEGLPGQDGQMVIGCSRLDEVVIDTADTLFARFEHLGVYGRAEVREIAHEGSGRAMALRFSDTEIFPKPVTLRQLKSFAGDLGLPLSLISLTKIDNRLFQAIYEEGHRRT